MGELTHLCQENVANPLRPPTKLLEPAVWNLPVWVKHRWQRMRDYQQAFIGDRQRLCILCAAPVSSCDLPFDVRLE
jgi:hypothetical protein